MQDIATLRSLPKPRCADHAAKMFHHEIVGLLSAAEHAIDQTFSLRGVVMGQRIPIAHRLFTAIHVKQRRDIWYLRRPQEQPFGCDL